MLRKLPPQVRKHLVSRALELATNPECGESLRGALKRFHSLHTVYRRTHYRMVYEVNKKLEEIVVRGVGPRENIYKKLRQMKLKPLLR